jgi:hypothetical protein
MKYLVVTGGVVSGLGKGISISSMGVMLKASGLRVTAVKIDPYLVSLPRRHAHARGARSARQAAARAPLPPTVVGARHTPRALPPDTAPAARRPRTLPALPLPAPAE